MAKFNVVYKSKEIIYAKFHRSGEWASYKISITIKDGGKQPIVIEMKLDDQPYVFDLPETKSIKAETITAAYEKMARFFRKFDLEFQ